MSDDKEGADILERLNAPIFLLARGAWAMGVAALFGASMAAPAAAREPAVSMPNATIIARFGDALDDGQFDFGAKAAAPLGEQLGVQGEFGVGNNDYFGTGGHVFWRDPSFALIGIWGSYDTTNDIDMSRFGAEADFYVDRFTLGGRLGIQSGDVDDGAFGRVDVTFYATDDLSLRVGGEFTPDDNFGRAGVEWHPAAEGLSSLSVFADGAWGDDDNDSLMAGLTYHFGTPGVSLIDRDRREDPSWVIFNHVESSGGQGPVEEVPIPTD